MAAGKRRLRGTVHAWYLETRERHRTCLVGDVDYPEEGRRTRHELGDVLVTADHHAATVYWKRDRQRRVGRVCERRAPVEPRKQPGPAHVLDVEDHEPAVPVAHVEAVAEPHRMMTAMVPALPRRCLAT